MNSSMSMTIPDGAGIAVAARDTMAVNSLMVAGFVALLYDQALTFDHEVTFIWNAPKSTASMVFIMNRYMVPCLLVLHLYESFFTGDHLLTFCKGWTLCKAYFTIICYVSMHALRATAIYNCNPIIRRLLWSGIILYTVSTVAFITAAYFPIISSMTSTSGACVSKIPSYLWVAWLPTVIFEASLFTLTVHSAFSRFPSFSDFGVVYCLLFRDAVFYFFVVTVSSISTLVVWAKAPMTLIALARPLALCMVTVIGNRLILNLKRCIYEETLRLATSELKTPISLNFEFAAHGPWHNDTPSEPWPLE